MATSEMITSYPTWIQTRWEAMFDAMKNITNYTEQKTPPTYTTPDVTTYHGTVAKKSYDQLSALLAVNTDNLIDTYWDNPVKTGVALSKGVGANELAAYSIWESYDVQGGAATQIDDAVTAFNNSALNTIEDDIYPAVQLQFLAGNCVFSSVVARFILDQYDKVNDASSKLNTEARLQQLDKGATRSVEMTKIAAQRAQSADMLQGDLMHKKVNLITMMEELKSKLILTANQNILQDVVNTEKFDLANKVTVKRWEMDNVRYQAEALSSIHGATPTRKSSSEEGWDAMGGFERALSLTGTAVSLGSAVGAMGKDLDWW